MSTGQSTQAGTFKGNHSPVGPNASQSALYYLFQEVSKLSSPVNSCFMGTNSLWIKSEEDVPSCVCSTNQSLHMSSKPQLKQESPLKVLSLINLQCERLLHQGEDDDPDQSALFLSHLSDPGVSSTLPVVGTGLIAQNDHSQVTLQSIINEKQMITASDRQLQKNKEDCNLEDNGHKQEFTVKCPDVCPVNSQVTDHTEDTVEAETSESEAPQSSELKFSVGLEWTSDWTKDCLSTQHTFYDFLPEAQASKDLCNDQQQTFSSEPLLPLDHNANIAFNTNSLCDKPSGESDGPQSEESSNETSHRQPQSSDDESRLHREVTSVDKEDSAELADQCSTWRGKRRKQPRPSRSASVQDPDFQGVTFRMDTELDDTKEQCRLLITSKYSKELPKSVKKPRLKTRTTQKSIKTSSDEESDSATSSSKGKVCASCCTRKTPMWRDAEDGTPLCNACGIRYKKYRVRCVNCWHIPKKEGNSISRCIRCGNFVRLTSTQRRPT